MFFSHISDFFRRRSKNKGRKQTLLYDQNGATAVEYVVLLATLTLVGIAAAGLVADTYKDQSNTLETTLSDAEKRITAP